MSGKLDQALDDITQAQRRTARRRSNQRRGAGRPAAAAPVGGIQKNTKPARGAGAKPAPAKATPTNSDSKIIVSNLPKDVSEQQIKEYFIQSVGPIKRVELSYGPNSQSRGIANVTFHKSDGASKAFQKLNGLLVDNRPIKIEIVVGAAQADKVIPTVKTLAERTSQPKAQPKSAAADKHNAAAAKGAPTKGAGGNKKRRGRNSRPAKKTQEELDSEMADYFDSSAAPEGTNNAAAPAPAPAATGDADMDEIAVCIVDFPL
ncbi:mRNA export mlo3 [Fusarium beomiforme]|uniref:mRNA export mlo3 n=1 Tax=Fusarium beomiforme TaxID=44412 RepID=A0A9P5DYG6_9HYPO|nr:mRNA export mlo3 [Fusarium beomiforme]